MNGISSKVGFGAVAGALTSVLVWIVGLLGLDVPGEIAGAITVIITAVVGYFVPETATVNVENASVKEVVSVDPSDVDEDSLPVV